MQNPQWQVLFDDAHRLGTFWQVYLNLGKYTSPIWIPSNNGVTNGLFIYINLPPDTEITTVQVNGFVQSSNPNFYAIAFYDDYNLKGNILAGKLVGGLADSRDLHYEGDIKNAKSLAIHFADTANNTQQNVTSITISGIGSIDPFESAYIPPTTTQPPPSDNGNVFTSILGILDSANHAVTDEIVAISPQWGDIFKKFEANFGQSLPDILALFGINIKQYSTALQAAFTALIDDYQIYIKNSTDQTKGFQDAIKNFLDLFRQELSAEYRQANQDLMSSLSPNSPPNKQEILDVEKSKLQQFIDTLPDVLKPIGEFLFGLWDIFFNNSQKKLNPTNQYISDRIKQLETILDDFQNNRYGHASQLIHDLFGIPQDAGAITKLISLVQIVPLMFDLYRTSLKPRQELLEQLVYADISPKLLPPNVAIDNYFRGFLNYDALVEELSKYGYSEDRSNQLLNSNVPFFSKAELEQLLLRGLISEKEHDKTLQQQAYTDEQIKLFKQLYLYYPSTSDILNMAQKGLFSNTVGNAFNQDTAFPTNVSNYLSNLGISDFWQHKLWAAHWQLPSFSEVIEMYHRGLIDDKALNEYTQISPILPYFRDKLVGLSHKVLSRLDIRKLAKTGQLSYQEIVNAFQAQGYDSVTAQKLANYTQKFDEQGDIDDISVLNKRLINSVETQYLHSKITAENAYNALLSYGVDSDHAHKIIQAIDNDRNIQENNSRTKDYVSRAISLVQHAYITGMLPNQDAYNELIRLGLTSGEANLELEVLQIERDIDQKKEIATILTDQLAHGRITIGDFNALLANYGFNAEERQYLAIEANYKAQHKTKHPTEPQLLRWYEQGIITHSELMEELSNLGYTDKYIMWIMDAESKKVQ